MVHINTEVDNALLAAGQRLAEQREKLKMDVKDCADTLKMPAAKLIAVEAGQKSSLGSEIFVRGYLRNYAKLLGVSEKEIFYLYEDTYNIDESSESRNAQQTGGKKKSLGWLPYLVGIIVIVLWFAVSQTLVSGKSENVDTNESHQNESVSLPLSPGDNVLSLNIESSTVNEQELTNENIIDQFSDKTEIPAELEEDQLAINEDSNEDENLESSEVISSEPLLDAETVKEVVENTDLAFEQIDTLNKEQELPASQISLAEPASVTDVVLSPVVSSQENQLYFSFTENCWVEVVDVNGEILISSIRLANTDLYVKGQGPFNITFGNVSGASLTLDNEPVVLTPERGNRILRITVGS